MSARGIDDLLRDVGRALRDPNLTQRDSEALACVIIKAQCSYEEARAAVCEARSRWPDNHPPLCVDFVIKIMHWRRPRPMVVHPPYPWAGSATNVIRVYTRLTGGATGERAAQVLGEVQLREEVGSAIRGALHRAVDNKQVANTNDPDMTESPHWSRKVQGAWVRDTLARSGA
ncbi:MAG TPA: hypothetical protein VHP33_28595 [Polyangiaceae bacterium]|nr:hypothetical protein [Polyangiaceae bacterium]